MPRFKILPVDQSHSAIEVIAADAGGALLAIGHLNCKAADVLQDDAHAFSARLNDCGMWSIFPGPRKGRLRKLRGV